MARRVFFSFEYHDVTRAMVVRNSGLLRGVQASGFIDAAAFERLKRSGPGKVERWIDGHFVRTSVTVVLVGHGTCRSRWVRYEIEKSQERGNGLLGIDVSKIEDLRGRTTTRCGRLPKGFDFYLWHRDNGYRNLGRWVERAAREAGR